MSGKTVEISMDSINEALDKFSKWITEYFKNIDTYGILAISAIGLGLIMFIVGFIIL